MGIIKIINNEINNFLFEGVSDIVYHFTYIQRLLNILKENKFHTSTNVGTGSDAGNVSKNKAYFFSTQRSKHKKVGYAKGSGSDVCIVLDGRKLNQKYKGFPVDYWGWSKNPKDWNDKAGYRQSLLSNELEDRIVLDEPTIDNAREYIKEIHIYVDPKSNFASHPSTIKELQKYSAYYGKNIPFYFYNDETDFANQNKAKAINANQLQAKTDADELHTSNYDSASSLVKYLTPILSFNDKQNKSNIIDFLENSGKKVDKFIEEINNEIVELKYMTDWRADDRVSSISAAIHNNRSNPSDTSRFMIKLLIDDMKKYDASSLKEYVLIKLGLQEPKSKEKENKPISILWDDELNEQLSWSKPIWSYIEPESFWTDILPSNYHEDLKMVQIINDKNLTFKGFVKKVMPVIGKEKIKKLFNTNNISFKNISPDENDYDYYNKDWKSSK